MPFEVGNRGFPPRDVTAESLLFETDDQIRAAKIMPGKGCVDGNPIEEQYFSQFATPETTDASSTTTGAVKETAREGNEGVDDTRVSPPSDFQPRGYSEEPSELNEVDEQGPDSKESNDLRNCGFHKAALWIF